MNHSLAFTAALLLFCAGFVTGTISTLIAQRSRRARPTGLRRGRRQPPGEPRPLDAP